MSNWEVVKTKYGYIIKPKEIIYCPLDGTPLLLHDFRVSYEPVKKFYHCDVHMKCPKCSIWLTFGVPIGRDEFEKLKSSSLHGKTITHEVLEYLKYVNLSKEEEEEIKKRLKSWNYW